MDYYAINALRENHAGWSLLRAQNAPLAVSFFMAAFTGPNQAPTTHRQMDDVLFGLRDTYGEDKFPRQVDELRAVHPHVASVLMDEATLLAHRDVWDSEPSPSRAG